MGKLGGKFPLRDRQKWEIDIKRDHIEVDGSLT